MSLICRKAFLELRSPFTQAKRLRSKINIQKPRKPHYERALYLSLTKPIFINPKKGMPLSKLCEKDVKLWQKEVENPLQRIIAGELLEQFKNSRLVVFFHMNPIVGEDEFKAYAMFHKCNMHFKNYGKRTMEMALKGTRYEAILDFYVSRNMILFSPIINIKQVLKISKKFPQLILLAALLDGKFISKNELMEYSTIPNLEAAQVRLVQTLDSVGHQLVSHLNIQQNILVGQLQERVKQLKEEK